MTDPKQPPTEESFLTKLGRLTGFLYEMSKCEALTEAQRLRADQMRAFINTEAFNSIFREGANP